MKTILENKVIVEPIDIKTPEGKYRIDIGNLSRCDICENSGKLYVYLKEINRYLPIRKQGVV